MAPLLLQHLGPLHRGEQVLVYVLAFGPFVLLGLAVWISRRRDAALDPGARAEAGGTSEGGRVEDDRPVAQAVDQPVDPPVDPPLDPPLDQPGDDQSGDDRAER